MKYSCYQQSSLIHGWLLNFWLGNAPVVKVGNPISDASFSFFTLLDAGLKSPSSDSGHS